MICRGWRSRSAGTAARIGRAGARVLLVVLCGCSTAALTYRAADRPGSSGYRDRRIDDTQFYVQYQGDAEPGATVESLLLYRCAEIAARNGVDRFVFVRKQIKRRSRSREVGETTAPTFGSQGSERTYIPSTDDPVLSASTFDPEASLSPYNSTDRRSKVRMQYGSTRVEALIRILRDENVEGSYDARRIIFDLTPKIARH
jgi:hypothetical protein